MYHYGLRKGVAWVPAGHILCMSPPIVMDEAIAAKGMDLIEESIAEVELYYGIYEYPGHQRGLL